MEADISISIRHMIIRIEITKAGFRTIISVATYWEFFLFLLEFLAISVHTAYSPDQTEHVLILSVKLLVIY